MAEGLEQPTAALQVIVLGSGGGPQENQTTAFLVRSTAERWSKGSVLAVDAGVHLSAITKIFERSQTTQSANTKGKQVVSTGPFTGLELSFNTPKANAGYVTSVLVDTYLITHPHLDHISAFVVNTAGLPVTRQKKLAGLPSTIAAFSNHIFNNVIWPNLSDENNGAGLISYMRLVEGGSSALGEGEARGFIEVCEGLQVKTWSISHGHCYEKHSHRGSTSGAAGERSANACPDTSPQLGATIQMERSNSTNSLSPDMARPRSSTHDRICVYDSSVYFIRDIATGKEVLIFGDVEPDSVSLSPRNQFIWVEAAPKILSGQLGGIFIECSYDDSRTVDVLFGHLAPRFVIEELQNLAVEVSQVRSRGDNADTSRKRKWESNAISNESRNGYRPNPLQYRKQVATPYSPQLSPKAVMTSSSRSSQGQVSFQFGSGYSNDSNIAAGNDTNNESLEQPSSAHTQDLPLEGLKVVIIHVKEKLDDGPDQGEVILRQLLEHERTARLGCEFLISSVGQSLYF